MHRGLAGGLRARAEVLPFVTAFDAIIPASAASATRPSENAEMIATVPIDVYRRAIERTVEVLGDEERLARYLHVPLKKLHAWRMGSEIPPLVVFLNCVDLILDDERSSTTQLYLGRTSHAAGGRR